WKNLGRALQAIQLRMMALVMVCLGLGTLALISDINHEHERSTARLASEAIRAALTAFEDVERTSTELMGVSVDALARDPGLRAAIAVRDAARALLLSARLYRDQRVRFGITHWSYWEPEPPGKSEARGLRNILRVGTPDMRGDFVERVTLARVARERRQVTGLDLGPTGLALRVLAPVEDDGQVIGYVELGKEIGHFLQDMKKSTGNDFGIMVAKRRMDEKKWSLHVSATGARNNWNDMPDLLLVENTSPDREIFRYSGSVEDVPDDGEALELMSKGGRSLARGLFPIRNAEGYKIGAVFVLRDVTAAYAGLCTARREAILMVVGVMITLGGVLVTGFKACWWTTLSTDPPRGSLG
ncbi:MAG TPA: cache domain-containing protein, partial [Anaeromyxobacteraceae bacterium]|nr:cache domain-containing protein [Anaeromyxobacteraceae bacterium]